VSAFSAVLAFIALRPGQFQPVHKSVMLVGAVLLAYSVVVQAVNVTRLVVAGGTLRVTHGPLPWRGGTRVELAAVRALACDRHSRRLVLRTALGEELVLAEDLPAADLAAVDAEIRARVLPAKGSTPDDATSAARVGAG
jgi:hypothetical protein